MSTASGASPFPPGCGGAGEAFDSSVLCQNAEVEPSVAVNPTNPDNIVGFWQQDRWSDGGAHGLLAGVSMDGGQTWSHSAPKFSRCAGGAGDNGGYHRSSDPWVSFSPNGVVHAISISFDNDTPRNAVLASRSTDGGLTWSDPAVLKFDNPRALGNNFNDKESITADPTDSNLVYAVWDRLFSPSQHSSATAFERSVSFHGPTWFARSTDNGQSWETARPIFDPKAINQTIGNQIDVLPDGTLVDGFNLINGAKNAHGTRGNNVAVLALDRRRRHVVDAGEGEPDADRRGGVHRQDARERRRDDCGLVLRLPQRRQRRRHARHRPLAGALARRRGDVEPAREPAHGKLVRHAHGAVRARVLRGRLRGPGQRGQRIHSALGGRQQRRHREIAPTRSSGPPDSGLRPPRHGGR
jgi:hypothetical protein